MFFASIVAVSLVLTPPISSTNLTVIYYDILKHLGTDLYRPDYVIVEKCREQTINFMSRDSNVSENFTYDSYDYPALNSLLNPDSIHGLSSVMSCPYRIDLLDLALKISLPAGSFVVEDYKSWHCLLPGRCLCDGVSSCLTDECGCANSSVFYCASEPRGCISFKQVCDGVADCMDQSDECLCQGAVQVTCGPNTVSTCLSEVDFCSKTVYYSETYGHCTATPPINCSTVDLPPRYPFPEPTPIYSCLRDNFMDIYFFSQKEIGNYCANQCGNYSSSFLDDWGMYCSQIATAYHIDFLFYCLPSYKIYNLPAAERMRNQFHISKLCDKSINCMNGADELGCPDRFYCNPNKSTLLWVEKSQLCDNTKDCPNGRDECVSCSFGALTSDKFLLRSHVLLCLDIILGVAICFLNGREGRKTYKNVPVSRVGKIDRILRLQICFFDFLIGFYLCMIFVATIMIQLEGDYCLIDHSWRSSSYCSALGVTFSISSQGSLIAISMMSIIRGITCTFSFVQISQKTVILLSCIAASLNLLLSVVPVIPLHLLRNIFRSDLHFNNIIRNPLMDSEDIAHVQKIHTAFYPNSAGEESIYKMLPDLGNITSDPDIFEYTEIGYYGSSPLCIHNMFKSQPSYLAYKISYCSAVAVILAIVSISYCFIVRAVKKSEKVTKTGDADSTNVTLKVSLMIISQLASWISFILAAGYFIWFPETGVPDMLFEVFAVVVIPANSLLNPIFYSSDYQVVVKWARSLGAKIFQDNGIEPAEDKKEATQNKADAETVADRETMDAGEDERENTVCA